MKNPCGEPKRIEQTVPGLHQALERVVSARFPHCSRILDCGAGSGAWIERLRTAGYDLTFAVDRNRDAYCGHSRFVVADLNSAFASVVQGEFAEEPFDLVTAVEVIEHLENPSHFLRECRSLLKPSGSLLITSPNPECAPARLKFLFGGTIRHFDRHGDATHITPIFPSLICRIASAAGFRVEATLPVPDRRNFSGTGLLGSFLSHVLRPFASGHPAGDCNLFILSPAGDSVSSECAS